MEVSALSAAVVMQPIPTVFMRANECENHLMQSIYSKVVTKMFSFPEYTCIFAHVRGIPLGNPNMEEIVFIAFIGGRKPIAR